MSELLRSLIPIVNDIEGLQFSNDLRSCHNMDEFMAAVNNHPLYIELIQRLTLDENYTEFVVAAIEEHIIQALDHHCADWKDKYDISVAVLLSALDQVGHSVINIAFKVATAPNNMFWARVVAMRLLMQIGENNGILFVHKP